MTFVAETDKRKQIPNPNVLLEIGFAAGAIGWQRIICVVNEKHGEREQQIFNIRHRRLPIAYTLDECDQRATTRAELAEKIKNAFERQFWVEHNEVADMISKLDVYCLAFLKQHAQKNTIDLPPTNQATPGAPSDTLDAAGFTHAASRLLDLGIIRSDVEKAYGRLNTSGHTLDCCFFTLWDSEILINNPIHAQPWGAALAI